MLVQVLAVVGVLLGDHLAPVRGVHIGQVVHRAGLVGEHLGRRVGDGSDLDRPHIERAPVPVPRVDLEAHVPLEAPHRQRKGAVAHQARRLGPPAPGDHSPGVRVEPLVLADQRLIHGEERRERTQVEEERDRVDQPHHQLAVAHHLDAHPGAEAPLGLGPEIAGGLGPRRRGHSRGVFGERVQSREAPVEERPDPLDVLEEGEVVRGRIRQDRPAPGIDEVARPHRLAVGPAGVLAQEEPVLPPVGGDLPPFGGRRDDPVARVEDIVRDQALEQQAGDAQVARPAHLRRVEGGRVLAVVEREVGPGHGAVGEHDRAERGREEQERDEQADHWPNSTAPGTGRDQRAR